MDVGISHHGLEAQVGVGSVDELECAIDGAGAGRPREFWGGRIAVVLDEAEVLRVGGSDEGHLRLDASIGLVVGEGFELVIEGLIVGKRVELEGVLSDSHGLGRDLRVRILNKKVVLIELETSHLDHVRLVPRPSSDQVLVDPT